MISDKNKQNIEECVVRIECINISDENDKERGTGFFIDKNIIATASHVISKYYSDPLNYIINIIPIKAKDDNEVKVIRVIESKRNNYISILEIEESILKNKPLVFTKGYNIKRGEDYYSFGYPSARIDTGYTVENKISIPINNFQSKKIDWDLGLTNERVEIFKGISGAPVIIDNMLVGMVQTESTVNGKTISIGMSSVNAMKEYIPNEYCKEYSKIEHIKNSKIAKKNKIYSIEDIEEQLRQSINLPIDLDFFEIDHNEFKKSFCEKITKNISNISLVGKSREEVLYCILNELKNKLNYDNVIIIGKKDSWEKLRDNIKGAILIPNFYAGELVAIKDNINIFIYGEDEHCTNKDKIELRRRLRRTIVSKLEKAGLSSSEAYDYVRNTNGLFIPLKRKLFNGKYNILPSWANKINDSFIIALLCGKWSECQGDKDVIEILSGKSYEEFIKDLTPYTKGEEPFIIEIHSYSEKKYQLANVEIAWELLDKYIDKNIWHKFEAIAYKVITQIDPIFYKPFEDHYKASFFIEKPKNSNTLKLGMIRSMIFRGIYRDGEYQYEVDRLVKQILDTVDSMERWGYMSQFFIELCEASPKAVIDKLEEEIKNPTGLRELFNNNSGEIIFGSNYYTNILCAVEQLLLYRVYVVRAVQWLFLIDDMDIKYKISNSPKSILKDIFCTWFSITTLNTEEKIGILNRMIKKYKNTWDLVYNELPGNRNYISNSSRPKYRDTDEIVEATKMDMYRLNKAYVNLCINNIGSQSYRWKKMIEMSSRIPDDIFYTILNKLIYDIESMEDFDKSVIKDFIRSYIYKHRYYTDSDRSMEELRIFELENLLKSIDFNNKAYDYLYLFDYHYSIPILNPIPYNKESSTRSENDILKEREIELGIQKFKDSDLELSQLLKLVPKEKHNNLGYYIAKYYTESKFEKDIYIDMLGISGIQNVILSYISYIYKNADNLVIKKAKALSTIYEGKKELYVNLLKIQDLNYNNHPYIMNEAEDIKELYWRSDITKLNISKNKETFTWCLEELKIYNNMDNYIEILHSGLDMFTGDEVLRYMNDLKEFNNYKHTNTIDEYYLNDIIKDIQNKLNGQFEKYEEIMMVELFLINIMEWNDMKCTQYNLKRNPDFYAQMIDIIYLHEGEEKSDINSEQYKLSNEIYNLYYKALFCPCEKDGNVDLDSLREWIENFRRMLENQNQINLFGSTIGRLFAYSPAGEDGYYPHESVREIIEAFSDEDLIRSYVISEHNKRGVYSPDAGVTEKEMALNYKANADALRIFYTETAKIYDRLFDDYNRESINQRIREEDGW
nr:serine protease [uncultured Romboutsia sp.]